MTLACTAQSLAAGEATAGTAPRASRYLIIEQPGPWGREALLDSDFPRDLGRQLLQRAAQARVKVLAARHPDRLQRAGLPERHVWLADCRAGQRGLTQTTVADPAELLTWDLAAPAAESLAPDSTLHPPMTFVCTHGSRDACCALLGRSTYQEALDQLPVGQRASMWEISHLGGHRFAPTALALPAGLVYGRLDAGQLLAMRTAAASGQVYLPGLRGQSRLNEPAQAADIAVRELVGIGGLDVLTTTVVSVEAEATPGQARVQVGHDDGRTWQVAVELVNSPVRRAESCGKDQLPLAQWQAISVEAGELPA